MNEIFYSLQDFYTYTKSVIYILIVLILVGMIWFWNFLVERDED